MASLFTVHIASLAILIRLTNGLDCYVCSYDQFNGTGSDDKESCINNPPKSSCGNATVKTNDNNAGYVKKTLYGAITGAVTVNDDLDQQTRQCSLEMSMINGEVVHLRRSCQISTEFLACEFVERKAKYQKAKTAQCFCNKDGCNGARNIEELYLPVFQFLKNDVAIQLEKQIILFLIIIPNCAFVYFQ